MFLVFLLVLSILVAIIFTALARHAAIRLNIQDRPAPPLKSHSQTTPLLGGVAIFLALVSVILITMTYGQVSANLELVIGILIGASWLAIGGILDDKYHLKPRQQIIWPALAAITVIIAGLGQDNITNPLYLLHLTSDPLLHLNFWTINIFGFELTLLTDIFTFIWLLVMIYVMKFLDGLNGLVSGMTIIGAGVLFFTSAILGQPLAAFLAVIVAGVYLGFLPFNFRGKIFLGEAGSTLAGLLLGVLAILGPAKISITLLVLGIPILDAIWVVAERIRNKKSPFKGDLRHLHFKLINRGLSSRRVVLLLWLLSFVFGMIGLTVSGDGVIQLILLVVMVCLILVLLKYARSGKETPRA